MKIVIVHTDFRIYWPARLQALSQKLSIEGHETFIIEIAGKGSPYAFAGTNNRGINNWTCLFPEEKMEDIPPGSAGEALFQKLDELNPDVVMAGAIAFPSGAIAVRWAKMRKKGVVVFDDARLEDVPRNFLVTFIKRKIYNCIDAILCPSTKWNETFKYWNFKPEQLFYGVDVVDNNFWSGEAIENPDIHLPEKFILAVGRQIPSKNFIFLLEVFNQYKKNTVNDISLVLVGDGTERKNLEEYVSQSGLQNVHFLPFVSQQDLKGIFKKASFFVLSSLVEPWGLVVNEVMASGLPAAVSNGAGCATTLINPKKNGYTFCPKEAKELLDIFEHYFSLTPEEQSRMKNEAINTISEWGIPRFVDGAYRAIEYASKNRKRAGWLNLLIAKKWNGRYNPI